MCRSSPCLNCLVVLKADQINGLYCLPCESGSLEQDADIVIFLYRDKYYDENSEKGDNAEVLIRKHRNGSVGTVELQFVGELTQFRDVEFRDMGPEQ